jgi:hypothetical protein
MESGSLMIGSSHPYLSSNEAAASSMPPPPSGIKPGASMDLFSGI